MTTDLVRAFAILIALSLTWSAGCRSPAASSSIYIDVNRVPPSMRDEYHSFAVNCSKCHSLSRALNAPVTDPSHWDMYVARMMRTAGSAISPHEAPVILRFLHWYTRSYEHGGGLPGSDVAPESSEETTPEVPAAAPPAPEALQSTPNAQTDAVGSPAPTKDTSNPNQTTGGKQ